MTKEKRGTFGGLTSEWLKELEFNQHHGPWFCTRAPGSAHEPRVLHTSSGFCTRAPAFCTQAPGYTHRPRVLHTGPRVLHTGPRVLHMGP